MKTFWVFYRSFSAITFTLFLTLIYFLVVPFFVFSKRMRLRWRGSIPHIWGKGLLFFFGVKVTVEGEPPKAPFYLVSNHLSYLDILVLHSRTSCYFVAKAELESWPILGFIASTYGTLFIDRKLKRDVLRINEMMDEVFKYGSGVVFFPEGGTFKGDVVQPFKASLLDLAAKSGLPVYYATIRYETPENNPPAWKVMSWADDEPFFEHITKFFKIRRSSAHIIFGKDPIQGDDRKVLAKALHAKISNDFVSMIPADESEATADEN